MKTTLGLVASLAIVSAVTCQAGNDQAPITTDETIVDLKKENFFVYGALGNNKVEVIESINRGTNIIENASDTAALSLEAGVGYRYSDHIFATLFANNSEFDEVTMTNYAASVNFRMADFAVTPYVGAVIAYSMLEWNTLPVIASGPYTSNLESEHIGMGVQGGAEYMLTDNITVFGKYLYLNHDHFTELYETSKVEHKNTQNIQGGLRYEF